MSKVKSKLTDLNDHLFAQMERLNDEDLAGDKLDEEIKRAHAMAGVANQIISNASLALTAQKALGETVRSLPEMLRIGGKE